MMAYTNIKTNRLGLNRSRKQRTLRRSQRGLAALILILIASIVSISLFMLAVPNQAQIASKRQSVNNQRLEQISSSLRSFAVKYGRLPCPAGITVLMTNVRYGVENGASTGSLGGPGNCVPDGGVTKVSNTVIGAVPWASLGLGEDVSRDAYGHRIEYMVLESATGSSFDSIPYLAGEILLYSGTPVSNGASPTGNQLNACSTTALDNACNQLGIFALLSRGANAYGAYTDAGSQMPSLTVPQRTQYPAEWENLNGDLAFVSQTGLQQTTFDDTVVVEPSSDYIAEIYGIVSSPISSKVTVARVQKSFAAVLGVTVSQRNTDGLPFATQYGGSACNTLVPWWSGATICAIGITADSNSDGIADMTGGGRRWISGTLPYVNLGLQSSETLDGWGRPLIYGVTSDLVARTSVSPPESARGINSGTQPQTMTTFGIVPYITAATSDVAFEVRSKGADGLVDNGPPGGCIITTTPVNNCDDIYMRILIPALRARILSAGQPLP